MVWFWAVFGFISSVAPQIGIGGHSFVPLWESALGTFAGVGSVLLTAGPAYKEYRDALGTVVGASETEGEQELSNAVSTVATRTSGRRYWSVCLLAASFVAALVIRQGSQRRGI
jgi:hypothetical protein